MKRNPDVIKRFVDPEEETAVTAPAETPAEETGSEVAAEGTGE